MFYSIKKISQELYLMRYVISYLYLIYKNNKIWDEKYIIFQCLIFVYNKNYIMIFIYLFIIKKYENFLIFSFI